MPAPCASGVGLVADQIADLAEGQPVTLCLLYEADSIDGAAVVFAKSASRATRLWKQPLSFVIAEGIARQTAGLGKLPDTQRSSIHERDTRDGCSRSAAARRSPRQQAPRGFRISQAHRLAAMCARTRCTAADCPVRSISRAMSASFSPKQ